MRTVFEYSMTGTLHGIRYIFESGRNLSVSKMIWTVFVISAAAAGIILSIRVTYLFDCTGVGKRMVPRLRELAPHGQRESGGGIHAT